MVKWEFSRRRYSNASRWRRRREAGLGAGDVETDHAASRYRTASSAISRERAACRIAVSSAPTRIERPCRGGGAAPSWNPASTASTTSSSVSPPLDVQLGREPDLGVDDAVGGEVLGALARDPVQRVGGLHDADGVRERLQVALQRAGVGRARGTSAASSTGVGRSGSAS